MRKKNYKGRCEKVSVSKSEDVCRLYSEIQKKYLDMLEENQEIRNTVFSKLQLDKMKEFRDVFNDPALADFVGNGGITTTIEAPVIMIIPIAIYV